MREVLLVDGCDAVAVCTTILLSIAQLSVPGSRCSYFGVAAGAVVSGTLVCVCM